MKIIGRKDIEKDGLISVIGKGINEVFGGNKKKDAQWDRIEGKKLIGDIGKVPGCKVKCIVQLDKSLKKQNTINDNLKSASSKKQSKTNSREAEIIKKNLSIIHSGLKLKHILAIMSEVEFCNIVFKFDNSAEIFSKDFTDDTFWNEAKKLTFKAKPTDKPVTQKSVWAVGFCSFGIKVNENNLTKLYEVYINLEDWKDHKYNNQFLLSRNSVLPLFHVTIVHDETNNTLFDYWYDINEFKKLETEATKIFKNRLNVMQPLV